MFVQKKKKNEGVDAFSEQIKEQSILKRFPKENPLAVEKNFLYCDPPEVILQSNFNFEFYQTLLIFILFSENFYRYWEK